MADPSQLTATHAHPNYLAVWIWLMVLAIGSVLASQAGLPGWLAVLVIYGAAVAKALIVAAYFMHLKTERLLILVLVAIPLALFFILLVALLPDFVYA